MTEAVERRSDDPRIVDIQNSVHEIRSDVRVIERRQERSDTRINDVERQVIENSAAQRALESIMNAEHRRLADKVDLIHEMIDRLGAQLGAVSSSISADRKATSKVIVTVLLGILGALSWWIFTKVSGG